MKRKEFEKERRKSKEKRKMDKQLVGGRCHFLCFLHYSFVGVRKETSEIGKVKKEENWTKAKTKQSGRNI